MQINIIRLSVILLLVGTAIGFGIGAASFSGQQATITQRLTATNVVTSLQLITVTQAQLVTVTQTISGISPTVTEGWREIKRFTGSTDMTTEPFNVPSSMWRIRWSYVSEKQTVFGFFVYRTDETVYTESVSSYTPGTSGVTYIYKGPSSLYLKIITAVPYTIIVEIPA